jgi:hypothetical protein
MVQLDDDDDGKLANWQTSRLVTPGKTLENPEKDPDERSVRRNLLWYGVTL